MLRLDGQVAIITGGASGVGLGIARVLREEGATVVIADIDGTEAARCADELGAREGHTLGVATDVALRSSVLELVDDVFERWGRIDILVANAELTADVPLREVRDEQWDELFGVNVRGVLASVQASLPLMTARRYGRVVLVSSTLGPLVGRHGHALYGASKAALLGFMRSAALEVVADNVTVNAVLPGAIVTPGSLELGQHGEHVSWPPAPTRRIGTPADVGWAVRYLAAVEAAYVTGQTLVVDGGDVLRTVPEEPG